MKSLLVSVTHAAHTNARTGIQTTVRGLVAGFENNAGADQVQLVQWSSGKNAFTSLSAGKLAHLGARKRESHFLPLRSLSQPSQWPLWLKTGGRAHSVPVHLHATIQPHLAGAWLLLPEVIYHGAAPRIIDYARTHGMRVAAIFHDAIPLSHPELVRREAVDHHLEYLRALSLADVIFPVSEDAAEAYAIQTREHQLRLPTVRPLAEAVELIGSAREKGSFQHEERQVRMLCVSTLEPRKNHLTLIAAFDILRRLQPDLDVRLDLVGDHYADAPYVAAAVTAATQRETRICWHGKVEPERLRELYKQCDFTVYPSALEGFGLPIGESLWLGHPCICANFGAMAEVAAGGGCLTVDVREPSKLAEAMLALAISPEKRLRLAEEATTRHLTTWAEYAGAIRANLQTHND
jgi:glycosyltransferase involved in cell wall biosynthesis